MTGNGVWIGASYVTGRPVPIHEPYPHICATTVTGRATGRRYRTERRQCAACGAARSAYQPGGIVSDTLTLLAAALDIADQGMPVFMLGRSKRPVANCPDCPKVEDDPAHDPAGCGHLTCHGFYAATRDPDRIAAILDAVPLGLLAIRTGTVAGVAVVDIDPRNGGRIDLDVMPPTRAVRTGSGGWHLYYTHPGGPLAAKVAGLPGVDLKADGGYVVAPPSIHPRTGQPYRWLGDRPTAPMPAALIERCRPADGSVGVSRPSRPSRPVAGQPRDGFFSGTAQAVPPAQNPGAGGISSPPALLAAHLAAVARAPEGTRRTTLYGAARGVARMVAAGAITEPDGYAALYEAGRNAGQTDRDTRAAIRGGFRDESVGTEGIAA